MLKGLNSFVWKVSGIAATFVSVVAMWWMMLSNFGPRPFAYSCGILSWCSCIGCRGFCLLRVPMGLVLQKSQFPQ